MRVVSALLALAVSLVIAGSLWAADEKKAPENRPHDRGAPGLDMILRGVNRLDLTDDQKAKIEDLKKEYGPKFKALQEKREGILTADQKKAGQEAAKTARDAGKSRREVAAARNAAMKITDDQKTKQADVRKEAEALRKEATEKRDSILTQQQKDQLNQRRGGPPRRRQHRGPDA